MRRLAPILLVLAAALPAAAQERPADAHAFQLARARDLAGKALAAGDREKGKEALEAYALAARLAPKDPVPAYEGGLLALDLGDGATAARLLAALKDLDPDGGPFHFLRGAMLQARGEYADAIPEYAAAREKGFEKERADDRHFECTVGSGFRLLEDLQFEKAVAVLKEAVARKPGHPMVPLAYHRMALAWRRLRKPKEAEAVLRECMEKFPTFAVAPVELADLCVGFQRYDEALELLAKAVKVDPDFAAAWLQRGVALTAKGAYAEAEKAFAEYDKRFPATALSEMERGVLLRARGEPSKALDRLRRALVMDPSLLRCHYHLSLCYRDLGLEEEAAAAMERWKKAEEAAAHGHGDGAREPR